MDALARLNRLEKTMGDQKDTLKNLRAILEEIASVVEKNRQFTNESLKTIKDYRWIFDQESSGMNQAIFNDQTDQIHESCLKTIAALIEILTRT